MEACEGIELGRVEEMEGLEGSYVFPELLLQRIWARGRFERSRAVSQRGERVEILFVGRWNRLAGPDFLGARLRIGGRVIEGDVELHLHACDWVHHGHGLDPLYAGVVLHAVLFPAAGDFRTLHGEREIPLLTLLPLLPFDLETYALDDAAERLAGRSLDAAQESFSLLSAEQRRERICHHAEKRWEAKVCHARRRIELLGWKEACHHAALECLGYRFNRAAMLDVAGRYPFESWTASGFGVSEVFNAFRDRWRLVGVRPLNHPHLRLRQYHSWCVARPTWPEDLEALRLAPCQESLRRRPVQLLRAELLGHLAAQTIPGPRWDAFLCDAALPMLAAQGEASAETCRSWWGLWLAGDGMGGLIPLMRILKADSRRAQAVCNREVQGLVGWLQEYEKRSSLSAKNASVMKAVGCSA